MTLLSRRRTKMVCLVVKVRFRFWVRVQVRTIKVTRAIRVIKVIKGRVGGG